MDGRRRGPETLSAERAEGWGALWPEKNFWSLDEADVEEVAVLLLPLWFRVRGLGREVGLGLGLSGRERA